MTKQIISVTDAARNFADCVNHVHYQDTTFVLLKNGLPVARLVPDDEKLCRGRDLAEILANVELPEKEALAWRRDLQNARKKHSNPRLDNGSKPGDHSGRRCDHSRRKRRL